MLQATGGPGLKNLGPCHLYVIQVVTNECGSVFFAVFFIGSGYGYTCGS